MLRRLRSLAGMVVVFALLSAGECQIGEVSDLLNETGTITVTNVGTETAVVAIIADDVQSYPTLSGGATAVAETNVGGRYEVGVVLMSDNAQSYREDLVALRRTVENLVDGSQSPQQKRELFVKLAGIRTALQQLDVADVPGCSGSIRLNQESAEVVNVTVNWVSEDGAAFWDVTCGSN